MTKKNSEIIDELLGANDAPTKPKFTWSKYQVAIFDFMQNSTKNAVIEAVAGSGKTTTLLECLNYTDPTADVAFVAFNKHIADELGERAPSHVHVSTLHSLGFANLRAQYGSRYKYMNTRKFWNIFNEMKELLDEETAETLQEYASVVNNLTSLVKATLLEPNDVNLTYICDRYGLHANGEERLVFDTVRRIIQISKDQLPTVIDFDDMIWATAAGFVPAKQFDFILVDEAQDLNNAQIQFVLKSIKPGGRLIFFGDRNQSIYGFRGADTNAIPNIIEATNATLLPLTITYRCPTRVVEEAQQFVPEIEARENAPEGTVRNIGVPEFDAIVQDGDMCLCRLNAPLVRPAFNLIRQGIKAVILGRDIGKNLRSLMDKIEKRERPASLNEFLFCLREYRDAEVAKLIAADKQSRATSLDDQVETIIALADGCRTIQDIHSNIFKVFSDEKKGVTFSTVHKAKGLESENVFIIAPETMPFPKATKSWEVQQEANLEYVAITRSLMNLYRVWK